MDIGKTQIQKAICITSYPPKSQTHGSGVGGLAPFTKNTLLSTAEIFEWTVLADIHRGEAPTSYDEDGIHVIRCWRRNSFSLYLTLISHLIRLRAHSRIVMIEFEFNVYGNPFVTGCMPLLILTARILGFEVTLVQHQVLTSLDKLTPHLGLEEKKAESKILGILLPLYYSLLTVFPSKIVVFDEIHRENLSRFTSKERIRVIPHGVEDHREEIERFKQNNTDAARNFTVLVFGFVAWYKGTDWIVEEFKNYLEKNHGNPHRIKLVIAGGESPTMKSNPAYRRYYQRVTDSCKSMSPTVTLTGFIEENRIGEYFLNSDLVVLPYRVLMSSSGPLAQAIGYERPFLISDILVPYTKTEDFTTALARLNLSAEDISFSLGDASLFEQVARLKNNASFHDKLTHLSSSLREIRMLRQIGNKYSALLPKKDSST